MPLPIKMLMKEISLFISIPITGWQETSVLLTAGWQETKRSPASRLAGDLAYNIITTKIAPLYNLKHKFKLKVLSLMYDRKS